MRVALLLCLSTTVFAGPAPVVGGTSVPSGKWPDAVAIIGKLGTCSGTLIAPTIVLTAGHCSEIDAQQVIANTTDYASQSGEHVNIKAFVAHPEWDTGTDVAIITLAKPITDVKPRALGTACTFADFTTEMPVELVGFGVTKSDGSGVNTKLNEATTLVIDPDCSEGHGCREIGGEFTAGGGGTDSCFGDSGGPVYRETGHGTILIGTVERGMNGSPTVCGGGGVYVRTDAIAEWVQATAGVAIALDDCAAQPQGDNSDDSVPPELSSDVAVDTATGGCAASIHPSGLLLVLLFVLRVRRPAGSRT
ncbi:MAG: trypsin-like serine protease [Kofleriaceae bacterium]